MKSRCIAIVLGALLAGAAPPAAADTSGVPARPWMNAALSPDVRADLVLREMTEEEKLSLVFGWFATDFAPKNYRAPAEARAGSAGYVPGVQRLGIPPQWQTDAGIGVATQGAAEHKRERTALPSGMALAASWDPAIARRGGAMIGSEARSSGFNVMLAGGVDLVREPRNGRNFEYGGEDPLLAGTIVGNAIAGIQSNHVIATIKHYALNDQETGRDWHDVAIDHDAARMSDLLAFQIGIEQGDPGSVMCAYNQVDGRHACENSWLLTDVLRRDWGFRGYVMSDWGATHSTAAAANAGLDQDSGFPFDAEPYFGAPLREAVASGAVSRARLDEMARRILRSMFANGLVDHPVVEGPIDMAAHATVTREAAEAGAVLLRNEGAILPLSPTTRRIAVIGGHADAGVLSGGGSSQVYPVGGNAVPGIAPTSWPGPVVYFPSSPLAAIRAQAPNAQVRYASGTDPAEAARIARDSDVVVIFANQWTGESIDTSLTLPDDQDALIAAVAAANPRTVVVLQTGGPVLMPWLDHVQAVLEAWYPGSAGGEAIANILFGRVNPSGHLPVTFPRGEDQLPRPVLEGVGHTPQQPFTVTYSEGAAVGYRWFDARGLEPLFPFGHGLSYTSFGYDGLTARAEGGTIRVSFTVRNTGRVAGSAVPQIYVGPASGGWEAPRRLGAFAKVSLAPGESREVSLTVDPRLLATFSDGQWRVAAGAYRVSLGQSSRDLVGNVAVNLPGRTLPAGWHPPR
ncbi:beta-glucosidase [Sphingosinicella ginsenosidimutans]|uniref:Glycosyl hydrolase n=1 Tax=Allosphingosinicella ginsenosidimutans TaxID=1176539 RepID=A0A5C6TUP4_9SPHN|nr:glycoside hydrolase family 3 C-terminal domain-containing protein [Sphingosinicella ginsenosidimutans]TXC63996.1 glycosyl hydrolase [Sphingosinicella ginsenosidimutans]